MKDGVVGIEMVSRAAVAMLVVIAGIAVVGPVAGVATTKETATATPTANDTNGSDAQFGAAVSSFMRASTADAEGSVDDRMWVAEYRRANASERPDLVRDRTARLDRRITRLEVERDALLNDNDSVTVQDRAKAAELAARIDALRDAINTTADAAEETGVDRSRLDELRTEARDLSGPEVTRMARNLTFGPPVDADPSKTSGEPGGRGDVEDVTERNATTVNRSDGGGPAREGPGDDRNGTSDGATDE